MLGVEAVLEAWDRVDGVGVKTDSQTAIRVLKYGAPPDRRPDFREWQERLKVVLGKKAEQQGHPCRIRLRWVKGHQGTKTTAGWLNNRVDELARRGQGGS